MKHNPETWTSDDGVDFPTRAECEAYEARLPYRKLLEDVRAACAADVGFAYDIESFGRNKLQPERLARGDAKYKRATKLESAIEAASPPPPPVPLEITAPDDREVTTDD